MKLFRTNQGIVLEIEGEFFRLITSDWDELVNSEGLLEGAMEIWKNDSVQIQGMEEVEEMGLLPPVGSQEVWAAGVTYKRSREARKEEAEPAGGGDFYQRVYVADRPELFPKAAPHRVVGHTQPVRIREDSNWNVPEPELTALVTRGGKIVGYTIGNDMSSRDIEGENPLYLPQAKVYDGSCSLGPGVLLTSDELPPSSSIVMRVLRGGEEVFLGETTLSQMKRSPGELVAYLYRECSFSAGCYLMTGTGVVPPSEFSLVRRDVIEIEIEGIGKLSNWVE
jgi:2-dehydro-3-deoxy-D-arabinonate dehydratase